MNIKLQELMDNPAINPAIQILKEVFINRGAHYFESFLLKRFKNTQEIKDNIEHPIILLKHRLFFREEFLFNAIQQPNNILLITIMSKHTINEIKSMASEGKFKVKKLRVLTFKHREKNDAISKSLSIHLNERPAEAVSLQVNSSLNEWKEFQKNNSNKIILREYDSIPTMQGFIVKDQYALIELLTFHSNPNERAAILAKKDKNPELFKLFSSSFEKLWRENS